MISEFSLEIIICPQNNPRDYHFGDLSLSVSFISLTNLYSSALFSLVVFFRKSERNHSNPNKTFQTLLSHPEAKSRDGKRQRD
jgi:hypothetical protein